MADRPRYPLLALTVGASLLATALAGCASIPASGPVRVAAAAPPDQSDTLVRVVPPVPRKGDSADNIVRGFLASAGTFEGDHRVARTYLTRGARWTPRAQTTVYSGGYSLSPGGRPDEACGSRSFAMTFTRTATVTAEGDYVAPARSERSAVCFTVQKQDGEWRITGAPKGLLLADTDLARAFVLSDIFFLNPDATTVVPDVVLLARAGDLPDTLVRRLVAGPRGRFAGALHTAVPSGTTLAAPVTVVDGVAGVAMSGPVPPSAEMRQALAAQVVWTLRAVPAVRSVRLTFDGAALDGIPPLQRTDSWPAFNPNVLRADAAAYVVRETSVQVPRSANVVRFDLGQLTGPGGIIFKALPRLLSTGRKQLSSPAVSVDSTRVAVVVDDRALYAGPVAGPQLAEQYEVNGRLRDVSWDRADTIWALDTAGSGRLLAAVPGGAPTAVTVEKRPSDPITRIRVSRDGVRIALVTGAGSSTKLWIGAIAGTLTTGPAAPVVVGLTQILPRTPPIADLSWVDYRHLIVLPVSAGKSPAQPFVTDLLGYGSPSIAAPPGLGDSVTAGAAPTQQPYLATRTGSLQRFDGRNWEAVTSGKNETYHDPAYPG